MRKSGYGYKFKKMFPDKWGSDYGVNTVRISQSCVGSNDRLRGRVSGTKVVRLVLKANRRRVS